MKKHIINDYTFFYSDGENYRCCVEIVNISEMIKAQCIACNLPYYETAHNREKAINNFLSEITKSILHV